MFFRSSLNDVIGKSILDKKILKAALISLVIKLSIKIIMIDSELTRDEKSKILII